MSDDTGITVVGTGDATTTPDLIVVDLGVSVRAESVAEASTKVRDLAQEVIESVTNSGVDRMDVVTSGYSIHPEYDHRDGEQRLLGYRVTNTFTLTLRDLDTAGATVDAAVETAGDAATVNRLVFTISDETGLRNHARETAWADALARAEQLATLAGRSLGQVMSVAETSANTPGPHPLARMALAESTPMEPGTATITVQLEVRFALD